MYKYGSMLFAVGLLATPAGAADLITDDPVPPEPPVESSVFGWGGFYGGLSIGYGFSDAGTTTVTTTATGALVSERNFTSSGGVIGGGFAGYNYQFDKLVIGFEGDLEGTSLSDTRTVFGGGVSSFDLNFQGSARARIGYAPDAFDRTLLYVTGGVTIGDIEYNGTDAAGFSNSDGTTEVGFTVGAGIDYAITDNLFVRGEYRYTDYGSESFTTNGGVTNFDIDTDFHSVRVGIAYKF